MLARVAAPRPAPFRAVREDRCGEADPLADFIAMTMVRCQETARHRSEVLGACVVVLSLFVSGCGGGDSENRASPPTTLENECFSKVVAALDLTVDAAASGNDAVFSQAANEVATTLGMKSVEYEIWLRLNPSSVQETYQLGKAKAKANARTSAASACDTMPGSASTSGESEDDSPGGDPTYEVSQEAIDFLVTDIEAHADDKDSKIDEAIEAVECDVKPGKSKLGQEYECIARGKRGGRARIEAIVTGGSRPSTFFDWTVVQWSPGPSD